MYDTQQSCVWKASGLVTTALFLLLPLGENITFLEIAF